MRCGDCKHWTPASDHPDYGNCGRWLTGYGHFGDHGRDVNIPVNEVVVEDDEGWGATMGKDFGCSLFEMK